MIQNVLDHLRQLVAIDTSNPPRGITADGPLVTYLTQVLEPLGFTLQVDDMGDGHVNIYACRGQPNVLFNVHMDTVPAAAAWQRDPWTLDVTADRAYGLGSCDIKGAAACLLNLAATLRQAPLAVLFSTDEEGANGRCINRFCQQPDLAGFQQVIVAEPTRSQAVLAHRGYLSVVGHFSGLAGHSSEARALADSAVHRACRWASQALAMAAEAQDQEHHGYRGVCFNLGRVDGGVKSNVIADAAEVRWSARLRPGDNSQAWYERFTTLPEGEHAEWTRPFIGPPLPANEKCMNQAEEFAQRHELTLAQGVNFWTEASLFTAAGVPALVLGPGDIRQAHCADEWVALEQLERVSECYQRIIEG